MIFVEKNIMKIDKTVTFLKNTPTTPTAPTAPAAAKSGVSSVSTPPVSAVAAASQARPVSSTTLLPSASGDFDAARVAEIRESISAGRYQVDTSRIADGLLASVRDLLNAKAP